MPLDLGIEQLADRVEVTAAPILPGWRLGP